MSKRVAIVGSRGFRDLAAVDAYVRNLPEDACIISGGAAGVDQVAEIAAIKYGRAWQVIRPDYAKHGRGAPKLRNRRIAEECTRMVAFWDGDSPGTANAVTHAVELGKPVEIRRG